MTKAVSLSKLPSNTAFSLPGTDGANGQVLTTAGNGSLYWANGGGGGSAYFTPSSFTATANQTAFTPSVGYQVGYVNVIRNGSQLAPADYTATDGTTVTLASPCTNGDIVVIEVFTLDSLVDAVPSTGGTVTGNLTVGGTISTSAFFKNAQIITSDHTIAADENALSVGPITIANGVTVTQSVGSNWAIV